MTPVAPAVAHEAVHEIDGWDDLRRRLQPDRRCFAFFHPQLPDEPLIFVEVALLHDMPDAIAPLIELGMLPHILLGVTFSLILLVGLLMLDLRSWEGRLLVLLGLVRPLLVKSRGRA